MVDESVRSVTLEGFPLAMTAIILTSVVLATIAVTLRAIVRMKDGTFGLDDWLIVGAVVIYIADTGLAVHAVSVGIGSKDEDLNPWMQAESQKFYIIWITVYVVAVALIKTSVCVTLRRIAAKAVPILQYSIWVLFALTWASFCVTFFGILTFCRPVEANWNTYLVSEGKATCASTETLIGISHTNTATSIVTDVGCVVLPGILLWRTQMSIKAKLQVLGLLSLASIASIATVARAPFISHYRDPTNNLKYYIGMIVLFSCVELGIGCIAASLPSLRVLYKRAFGRETQASSGTPNANTLITIGGGRIGDSSSRGQKRGFTNPTDQGITSTHINRGESKWERLSDEGSDKGILVNGQDAGIRVDDTFTVELEPYNH
ncbi:integral membrane [Fusarium sporotrichioides]|uniref:Integral membrane n=1 Tax=Fusarium sporotrichioides TaxID=5514 RepID=A0A395RVE0_FUSSP|nr:integral membrane [Fusarium sporotrichioides]